MSGLEVVALIPAIVSAFGTISVEYREWRKRRDDRRSQSKNVALQKRLTGNGEAVQDEYDEDLRLLGPVFRRGDSTGRESLMQHLIILQSTVISLLRDRQNDLSYLIHPNHNSINQTTKSARNSIVTTLSEQYQRLAQARPIARLAAPTHQDSNSNCLGTLTCATRNIPCEGFSFGGGLEVEFSDLVLRRYSCDECDWEVTYGPGSGRKGPKTKDGQVLDWKTVLDRFHYRDELRTQKNGYRCYLCGEANFAPTGLRKLFGPAGVYEAMWEMVEAHIRKNHYFGEFR
ncbi:hypothetical protein BJX99DRAFT_233702 [Aspergillus californicus]